MAAPMQEVMTALATRLNAVDELAQVFDHPTSEFADTPAAVVGLPELIDYNVTIGGFALYHIPVRVLVPQTDWESGVASLAQFMAPTGAPSIKRAIEDATVDVSGDFTDQTWHEPTVFVRSAGDIGSYAYGSTEYLGAEWLINIIAP